MATPPTTAHCMRCGHAVTPIKIHRITYPNKRVAERGECPTCGTTTSKFVKAGA